MHMGHSGLAKLPLIISRMDTNHDGELDRDELMKGLEQDRLAEFVPLSALAAFDI